MGDTTILSIPSTWLFPKLFLMFLPQTSHKQIFKIPDIFFSRHLFQGFGLIGMGGGGGGETCLPRNAYFLEVPGYTLSFRIHVCSSEHHSNLPFEPRHDKTNKIAVRPTKTQLSLGIRPVWSESSLSAWRNLGSLATHWAHTEDTDKIWRMSRLISDFAGRTLFLLCSYVTIIDRRQLVAPRGTQHREEHSIQPETHTQDELTCRRQANRPAPSSSSKGIRIRIDYWWNAETLIIHQDLWLGKLVPSSHQRSEFSNTILFNVSRWDQSFGKDIPIPDSLGEAATVINICISSGCL